MWLSNLTDSGTFTESYGGGTDALVTSARLHESEESRAVGDRGHLQCWWLAVVVV